VKALVDLLSGSCDQTREQLSAYLEGELTGVRRLRVRMHLAGCSACSAALRSLRKTVERLRELGDLPDATPSVAPAVVARVRELD
jgi:anti-sigma factor RsiW